MLFLVMNKERKNRFFSCVFYNGKLVMIKKVSFVGLRKKNIRPYEFIYYSEKAME